jgi:hypothetical protein
MTMAPEDQRRGPPAEGLQQHDHHRHREAAQGEAHLRDGHRLGAMTVNQFTRDTMSVAKPPRLDPRARMAKLR